MPVPTVLLCVRDSAATLDCQLAALHAQDLNDPWRLVVVDNASTDGSRAIVERWAERMPHLELVDEARPGSNRARNRGLREIDGGVVACCDADDRVSPSWLREMTAALEHHDVVGGALDPDALNRVDAPRQGCVQQTELPSVFGWSWVVGANLGFHARVAEAIGGFDPEFSAGSDEIDFCLRAQYAGFTVGFAPDAVVAYRLRDTARAVMRQRFVYGRGHEQLIDKHARLGRIESTLVQRWKSLAVHSLRVVGHAPDLAVRRERLHYLASVAYVSGRVTELARETGRARATS